MSSTDAYLQQIHSAYPDLSVALTNISLSGGQFSDVLILNERLIFRFPKSAHASAELYPEIAILKALEGKLPLPIPRLLYISERAPGQLAFMGYPMIPGQPLLRERFAAITDETALEQIASELATFLKVLNALPLDTIPSQGETYDSRAEWQQTFANFEAQLFPSMRPDARQQITESFAAALNDPSLWEFQPVICHGDFGTGNILYADGHITGVIDFTFCAVGDPAQDVGALLASYGEAFIERVFQHYPALRLALPRARFIRSTYALWQAFYALRDGNQEDFDDGMRDYV
ncbi:MAG: aminoglycoside phosphotransferase family protein [Chloroflexota bacterium]